VLVILSITRLNSMKKSQDLNAVAILLAAGKSKRYGSDKLWVDIDGRPAWLVSYDILASAPSVKEVVVVVQKSEILTFSGIASYVKFVPGGETRMLSFLAGASAVDVDQYDVILDHNGASPFLSIDEIEEVIHSAFEYGGAAVSQQCVDSVHLECNGFYSTSLSRDKVRIMQTPQAVRVSAFNELIAEHATDLTSDILHNIPVRVVEATRWNRKLTFPEDLVGMRQSVYYLGEDSHRFSDGGKLIIGGLTIDKLPKLAANSDGDVVFHAIGRALAQANSLDFDSVASTMCSHGITDSSRYLRALKGRLNISRVSIHIEAKLPRISDLPMAASVARALDVPKEVVRIEAMTGEELTSFGRGEGIRSTCLLTCLQER